MGCFSDGHVRYIPRMCETLHLAFGVSAQVDACGLAHPHTVSDQVNLHRPTAFQESAFFFKARSQILFWFLFHSLLLKGQRQQGVFRLQGFGTSGIMYIRFFSEPFFGSEGLCCQSCSTFRSSIGAPLTYVLMCVHRPLQWEGWAL